MAVWTFTLSAVYAPQHSGFVRTAYPQKGTVATVDGTPLTVTQGGSVQSFVTADKYGGVKFTVDRTAIVGSPEVLVNLGPGSLRVKADEYGDYLTSLASGTSDPAVAGFITTTGSQTQSALDSGYVARSGGSTIDVPVGSTVASGLRINQNATGNVRAITIASYGNPDYPVKIDHYGTTNGHVVDIASHTDPGTDPDYTVLGVSGNNTDFGTVKFVNNAAQTGGAVVAAWGTTSTRTAPIYVADNWGAGDGFQSVHEVGSNAVAFRAAFNSGGTYSKPVIWLPVRHTANDVILVENAVAQTSGSLMYLNQQSTGTTAPLIRLANAGSGYLIDGTAEGFAVDNGGNVRTGQLFNISSFSNSRVILGTTGTQIDRNIADGNAALKVQQTNASSTGDVLQVLTSGSTLRSRFNKAGTFMTRASAAPALADLVDGEAAVWVDPATGDLKVTARISGALKTGTVTVA